jgi:hypothetical protein
MRNAMDAQEVSLGWWPGNTGYGHAAFFAYAHPTPEGFAGADVSPGRWDADLGEHVLDWDGSGDAAPALTFLRKAFHHAGRTSGWDPDLARTAEGIPPPVT